MRRRVKHLLGWAAVRESAHAEKRRGKVRRWDRKGGRTNRNRAENLMVSRGHREEERRTFRKNGGNAASDFPALSKMIGSGAQSDTKAYQIRLKTNLVTNQPGNPQIMHKILLNNGVIGNIVLESVFFQSCDNQLRNTQDSIRKYNCPYNKNRFEGHLTEKEQKTGQSSGKRQNFVLSRSDSGAGFKFPMF